MIVKQGWLRYSAFMELTDKLKQKVADYKVSPAALAPIKQAPLLFVVGITAAGKNATTDYLFRKYSDRYHSIVSHTTRSIRAGERPDVEYHFVDFETMEDMIDHGEFVEVQVVHSDNLYGTSIAEIKRAQELHMIACTDIEIQGADDYLALGLNAKAIFLLPPSYEVWKKRLLTRYESLGEVDPKDLRNRLNSALVEIEHALSTKDYYIVINDDLVKSSELVHEIANGGEVEPHYHKAVKVAEELMAAIRSDLDASQ